MPFESWVERAIEKWPDVPALYGWLSLDRRGRWRIRGETITRPQIMDTIGANYAADARGCWFFQNGPQRGYMKLEWTPFVLRRGGEGDFLVTHTGRPVEQPRSAHLDEEGSFLIATEHGAGGVDSGDLDWVLARLHADDGEDVEDALFAALATPSGSSTRLRLTLGGRSLPVDRLDDRDVPDALGFVREPQP